MEEKMEGPGHDILFEDLMKELEEDFQILKRMEELISEINKNDPKQLEELKELISKAKKSKNKLLKILVDKLESGD